MFDPVVYRRRGIQACLNLGFRFSTHSKLILWPSSSTAPQRNLTTAAARVSSLYGEGASTVVATRHHEIQALAASENSVISVV